MSVKNSDTLRNAELDAYSTTFGASAKLRFYAGTPPTDESTALSSNTLLAEFTLSPDAAAAGTKQFVPTALTVTATAAGLVRFYRIYNSAGSTCHEQGIVAQPWAGSTAFVLNQHVSNGGNAYKCTTAGTSASSGGPTGTGTGITDGTAVWDFVDTTDLTLDNTNIASGQSVKVNSMTKTAPG